MSAPQSPPVTDWPKRIRSRAASIPGGDVLLDLASEPSLAEVRAVREARCARFTAHLEGLDVAALPTEVDVLENGSVPALMCFHVVLEEEFEHLRYAARDLTLLGG